MSENGIKKGRFRISKNFIFQGGLLAMSGIIVRIIGMLYRIPMVNIIGSEGNGIYGVAYNIYNIALVLSSYGMPMAVSKLVSARLANNQTKNVKKIFDTSLIFSLITGGIAAAILFFGAGAIESTLYSSVDGLSIPLKVLAPTVFIVAIMGVFRGYFQGHGNMVPTALSQLLEQIVNAIVSIVAPLLMLSAFAGSSNEAAYGAAGGTLGTCIGALTALAVLVFIFVKKKNEMNGRMYESTDEMVISSGNAFRLVAATVFPIILGQTFYNISAMLDDMFFSNALAGRLDNSTIKVLIGNYSSCYTLLLSIPQGIASAMAASLLPSLVSSFSVGEHKEAKKKLKKTIRITMMVAVPFVFLLTALGQPIIRLLFSSYDSLIGATQLQIGSVAIVFYALTTIYASALQGIGKLKVPVINSCISLAIHIPLVLILLNCTDLNVYALVIGTVTFSGMTFVLNLMALYKNTGYKQEITKTFMIPTICSALMAIAGFLIYSGLYAATHINIIALFVAVVVCIVVYVGLLLFCSNRKYY